MSLLFGIVSTSVEVWCHSFAVRGQDWIYSHLFPVKQENDLQISM